MKQYDCSLKLWWNYCSKFNIDPYESSVPYILKFLSENFNSGASYGTLNTTRSALSLLIGPKIGSDDRIKRFFKGVFRLKPPMPKYNVTWDPAVVLNMLEAYYPNEEIGLEKLTKKLVTMLALTTSHRVQTLALIKIKNIKFTIEGVQIKITDLIKTSRRNALQPIFDLKCYPDKPEICPVNTIKSYVKLTEPIRKNSENLILTFKKPHQHASSQTISRWIKSTLSEAGVDTSIFSTHSTRHASSSAACRAGVSVEVIRRTAGWSKNSDTFAKFYNRPLAVDPYQICDTIINNM